MAAVLQPKVKWDNCRFTVMVSYIDPCYPAEELHTNSRAAAAKEFREAKARMERKGGEWIVEWWEHPKDRATKRNCYRRGDVGERFLYCAEFPRSKTIERYDYMSK